MKKFLAVLASAVILIAAKSNTSSKANDATALQTYNDYRIFANEPKLVIGEWTDDKTCSLVEAYEQLSWLIEYTASSSVINRITPATARAIRLKFAEPLVGNLSARIKTESMLSKSCDFYIAAEGAFGDRKLKSYSSQDLSTTWCGVVLIPK